MNKNRRFLSNVASVFILLTLSFFQAGRVLGADIPWTPSASNPIISVAADGHLWNDPTVIKTGSTYVMYVTRNVTSPGLGVVVPYRATSADGIHWTFGTTPLLSVGASGQFDDGGVETPTVVVLNGVYHMYYMGYRAIPPGAGGVVHIGHATSNDGITWTKAVNPAVSPTGTLSDWNGYQVAEPGAIVFNNKIYLYYTAVSVDTTSGQPVITRTIGLAISSDGSSFEAQKEVVPVLTSVYPRADGYEGYSCIGAAVIQNQVHLFYDVFQFLPGTIPSDRLQVALHHAVSSDGETNFVQDAASFLVRGEAPWDTREIRSPFAMQDGNTLKLWYAGDDLFVNGIPNFSRPWGIGYAEAPLPATPPSITGQPQPLTVTIGQPANFSVTAAGDAPFSYQWFKNNVLIPGANGSSYTTPDTVAGDDGSQFKVTVNNATNQPVTSNPATLSVNALPTVALPTMSPNGGSFTTSVQVTLACATPGAQIRYTTDGSVPTDASPLYSAPFTLTTNTTVKAIALNTGMNPSAIASASFTAGSVNPPALVSDLSLTVPSQLPVNGALTVKVNSGVTLTSFSWSMTRLGDQAPVSALSRSIARATSAAFTTSSPDADLSSYALVPGYYSVTVTGTDSSGASHGPVQQNTTLVAAPTILGAVLVRPNPWRSDQHNGPIVFDNLPAGSTVKLFTISGHFVRSMTAAGSSVLWDRANESGDKAASGLYLYLVTDPQGNQTRGKLTIIK